jgi:hypothetical protein
VLERLRQGVVGVWLGWTTIGDRDIMVLWFELT